MKVVEFRICMPLTVEEYQKCQLYLVAKGTLEDAEQRIKNAEKYGSDNSVGVVILKNESYAENNTTGQYTLKKLNILHKMPKWLLNFVDKKYCTIEEQCWNAYPYIKTTFQSSGFPKGKIQLESSHHSGFDTEYNPLNLSDDLLNLRKIIYIDIVNDKVSSKEYNSNEDPSLFLSQKTGRGHFQSDWKETSEHLMTCYKLITLDIPYFGLFCSKIENWIISAIRDNLLKYHKKAFCWIDEWFDLKIEDIRNIEKDVQTKLKKYWPETGQDISMDSLVDPIGNSEPSKGNDQNEHDEHNEKGGNSEESDRNSSTGESLTNEEDSQCDSSTSISDNEHIKNDINKADRHFNNIEDAYKNSIACSSTTSLNYKKEVSENGINESDEMQSQIMNSSNVEVSCEGQAYDLGEYEVVQGESEIESSEHDENEYEENEHGGKEEENSFDETEVDKKKRETVEYFFFKKNKNEYGEYLYKIGDGMFYSWTYRYFNIKDNKLYYYVNDEMNELRGEINLLNAQIHWVGEYKGRHNVFVIQCFYKNAYYLSVDDEIQAKKCMIDIQMASLINETNNSKNNIEKEYECDNIKVENDENLMDSYNDADNDENSQSLSNLNGEIKNDISKHTTLKMNKSNEYDSFEWIRTPKKNKIESAPTGFQSFNSVNNKGWEMSDSWTYDNSSSCCDEYLSPLLGNKSRNTFQSCNLKDIINMLFGKIEGIEMFEINKDIQYKGVKELLHELKISFNTSDRLNNYLKDLFIFKKKRGKRIEKFLYIILIFLFFIFFHKIFNFLFYFFIPIFFFFLGAFIYNDKFCYYGFCSNSNYNVYKYSFNIYTNINVVMSILLNNNKIHKGEYYQNVISSKNKYVHYVCSYLYFDIPIFKQIYEFYRPRKFFMTKYFEEQSIEVDKMNSSHVRREKFDTPKNVSDKKQMRSYIIVQYTNKTSKEYFSLINLKNKDKFDKQIILGHNLNEYNMNKGDEKQKKENTNFNDIKECSTCGIATTADTLNNEKYVYDFSKKNMSNIVLRMSRAYVGKLIQWCILGLLKLFFKIIKNTFFDEYVKGEGFDIYVVREKGNEICNIEYLTCYNYKSSIFNNYLNIERCKNVIRLFSSNDNKNSDEKYEIYFDRSKKNNLCIDENEENIKLLINKKRNEKEICRDIFFNINNEGISKNMIKYIYNLTRLKYVNTNKYIGLIQNIDDIFFIINLSKVFLYIIDKIEMYEIKNHKIINSLTNRHSDFNFYSDNLFINNVIYILSGLKLLYNTFDKSWVFPKKNEKFEGKYNNSYIYITMTNEMPITFSILTENYKTKTKLHSEIHITSDSTMGTVNIFINNDIIIKSNNNYELRFVFPNISLTDLIKGNLTYTFCNSLVVTDTLGNWTSVKFIDKHAKCGQFCGIVKRNETITNTLSGNIFDKIIIDDDKGYSNTNDIQMEIEYNDDSNSVRLNEEYIKVRTLMKGCKTKM
ncbi:phosphatidylinositol transfer protein, putative [Plasmodium chabaudi adami]|uniref:Phosphatidylinositol transfer protein, putative n=1 Tax=Plasmodium chabaudi adami TaxID=5826 RepID=A0A1D3S2H0_PLACE|nr:phosphatidylinositol transfer protein, putative [Plasmodium chabaudi adami]